MPAVYILRSGVNDERVELCMKNITNSDILARSEEAFMSTQTGRPGLVRDKNQNILSKAVKSEEREIEALYGIFRKPLLSFFKLKLPSDEDPEDNVQALFKRLVEIRRRPQTDMSRWLIFKIAQNMVVDRFRWRSRQKICSIDQLKEPDLTAQSPLQDQVFEGKERLADFQNRLEELAPRCRQVFILHRVYGYSHKEVAAHMDISVSTVEKHMIKATEKVNQIMKDMS